MNLTRCHQLATESAPAMEVDTPNVQDVEMGLRPSTANEDNEETIQSSNCHAMSTCQCDYGRTTGICILPALCGTSS